MKAEKYYFILAVITGILCAPALGEAELPLHKDNPLLIGRANPTLAGIEELYVFIVQPDGEPNKDGLVWEELRSKVERTLKEAGVKARALTPFPRPYLRVYIDMLKLPDSQKYAFRIQTSLARTVILPMQRNLHLQADVFKTRPVMQSASVQNMPAKVTDVVLEQVEAFVHAYLAANPKGLPSADVNDIVATKTEPVRPAVKSTSARYQYVASKNSKVFHSANCSSAKRIKPKNLVGYNRDEAIKAGKRPCKLCKP
jgi:hypothetical protein